MGVFFPNQAGEFVTVKVAIQSDDWIGHIIPPGWTVAAWESDPSLDFSLSCTLDPQELRGIFEKNLGIGADGV